MTRMGVAALLGGIAALVLGLVLGWTAFDLLGIGLLVLVVIGLVNILRPSRLAIDRAIQPPRVPKGSPAIAVLTFANRGRYTIGVTVAITCIAPTRPFPKACNLALVLNRIQQPARVGNSQLGPRSTRTISWAFILGSWVAGGSIESRNT